MSMGLVLLGVMDGECNVPGILLALALAQIVVVDEECVVSAGCGGLMYGSLLVGEEERSGD